MEQPLDLDWRYFSLEQVNWKEGETSKVWEQPEDSTRSLAAFKGAEAARRQGREAFDRFHHALLHARHREGRDLSRETVLDAAREATLDLERFTADLESQDILDSLARDHQAATQRGVFGTPTVYFGEGKGAYIKMRPATRGPEALKVFERVRETVAGDLNIEEIKRPSR
ncbi:MAG: DsbA family protein [Chloroflexota bacterium]|nr:DsbA family protein [Chloroflexota bacterium]